MIYGIRIAEFEVVKYYAIVVILVVLSNYIINSLLV